MELVVSRNRSVQEHELRAPPEAVAVPLRLMRDQTRPLAGRRASAARCAGARERSAPARPRRAAPAPSPSPARGRRRAARSRSRSAPSAPRARAGTRSAAPRTPASRDDRRHASSSRGRAARARRARTRPRDPARAATARAPAGTSDGDAEKRDPAAPPAPEDAERTGTRTLASGRSRRGWSDPQQPRAELNPSRTKMGPRAGVVDPSGSRLQLVDSAYAGAPRGAPTERETADGDREATRSSSFCGGRWWTAGTRRGGRRRVTTAKDSSTRWQRPLAARERPARGRRRQPCEGGRRHLFVNLLQVPWVVSPAG